MYIFASSALFKVKNDFNQQKIRQSVSPKRLKKCQQAPKFDGKIIIFIDVQTFNHVKDVPKSPNILNLEVHKKGRETTFSTNRSLCYIKSNAIQMCVPNSCLIQQCVWHSIYLSFYISFFYIFDYLTNQQSINL